MILEFQHADYTLKLLIGVSRVCGSWSIKYLPGTYLNADHLYYLPPAYIGTYLYLHVGKHLHTPSPKSTDLLLSTYILVGWILNSERQVRLTR